MHMDNKVSSHRRFIAKMERDLKSYYDEADSKSFVKTYNTYTNLSQPSDYIEELYYESLLDLDESQKIVEHALKRMNQGLGDYEMHTNFLLEALNSAGRHTEVLEFSEQLLREDIPHEFRFGIQQHIVRAEESIHSFINNPEQRIKVTKEDFQNFDFLDKMTFLEDITELVDLSYKDLILQEIKDENEPLVYTQMLLYLRSINYKGSLEITKLGETMTVQPSQLPELDKFYLVSDVLPILMDILDATNPSLKDEAEIMLYGHLLYIYPFKPDFSNEDIADAYAHYLQDLIGQSYDKNNHPEIRAWIEKIDKTMIENEQ